MEAVSIIQPKRPTGQGWQRAKWWACPPQLAALGYPVEAWEHPSSGLFALSAVEVAREPGKADIGLEYHPSVSINGQRCSSADALFVLAAFDLSDAKEDNHVPSGRVRNFWRPVADALSGYECACLGQVFGPGCYNVVDRAAGRPSIYPEGRMSAMVLMPMSPAQRAKLKALGGAPWVRARIDRAKEPT